MAGNIPGTKYSTQDFLSKFGNIAQSSQYRAHWQWPPNVRKHLNSQRIPNLLMNEGSVLCKATSLPGSSLATHDVTTDFYGVTQKSAYRRQFDGSIDLTFYIDSDYGMLYMFEGWLEYIMQMQCDSGDPNSKGVTYTASYPDSYRCLLYLHKFNKDHQGVPSSRRGVHGAKSVPVNTGNIIYTFVEAFPQNISSTSVSYDPSQNLEFTVSFAYTRYITSKSVSRNGGTAGRVDVGRNQATKSSPIDNPSNPTTRWFGKNSTFTDRNGRVIMPRVDELGRVVGAGLGELINQPTGEGGQLNQAVKGQNVNSNEGGGNSTIDGSIGDFGIGGGTGSGRGATSGDIALGRAREKSV